MKKKKFVFFCLLSFFALSACSNTNDESQNKEQDESRLTAENDKPRGSTKEEGDTDSEEASVDMDNVTVADAQLSFIFSYDDVEHLMRDSGLSVEGEVVATENYVLMDEEVGFGSPFTKLTFKVNQVLSGDSSLEGLEITILEGGGYITAEQDGMKDKFADLTEEELKETSFVIYNGHRPSEKGDILVAFLAKGSSETGFEYYSFTGAYQSKFEYDENSKKYVRPSENYDEWVAGVNTRAERSDIEELIQIEEDINDEVTKLVEEAE
ncbi:hypothetical protein [Peribacillus simplex]|uniref:hypothetical protein n=1 Tax=Peribacillus simplex TaxID=1478 RepID=UPI0036D8C9FD